MPEQTPIKQSAPACYKMARHGHMLFRKIQFVRSKIEPMEEPKFNGPRCAYQVGPKRVPEGKQDIGARQANKTAIVLVCWLNGRSWL